MDTPSSTFGEMLDTGLVARRFYYARLASLTPAERIAITTASSRMVRSLAERAIRRDHPDAPDEEIEARLAVRLYGRATVERVLHAIPSDAR